VTTVLRPATLNDAPRIAEIHAASRAAAMPWIPVLHSPEEDLWFYRTIVIPKQRVSVCEVNRIIIGFSATSDGWLHHLYLHPSSFRKGVGSKLLMDAKEGNESLDLWVFQRNTSAQAFYRHHGFVEMARTDGTENEEKSPDIHMRWSQN